MFTRIAAAIFALFAVTAPAHAVMVAYPDAVEAVNITFPNDSFTPPLTGEMSWVQLSAGEYSYPHPGPTGLYVNGLPFVGAGPPDGASISTPIFGDGGSPYAGNIYANLADLPNSLKVSDFYINSSLASIYAGKPDGIAGVSGSVHCVSGCGLNPVPLPAALPMFGAAVAGLGGAGWWKRRKDSRNRTA